MRETLRRYSSLFKQRPRGRKQEETVARCLAQGVGQRHAHKCPTRDPFTGSRQSVPSYEIVELGRERFDPRRKEAANFCSVEGNAAPFLMNRVEACCRWKERWKIECIGLNEIFNLSRHVGLSGRLEYNRRLLCFHPKVEVIELRSQKKA